LAWTIEIHDLARKQLRKLDPQIADRIVDFLRSRLTENPYRLGKLLNGEFEGKWSYRVGDYRVICVIYEERLVIEVVRIGHRREIYR